MDIKTVFDINTSYGQNRIGRGDSSAAASGVTRGDTSEISATDTDRVTLSDGAKLVAVAARTAQDTPDVRADKVATLKAQVEAGTYEPDSKKIAQKMLTMESDLFG